MSLFSRAPLSADQVIAKMRSARVAGSRDRNRYREVIELRNRFGDANILAAGHAEQFWLNAPPVVAVLRWGSCLGPAIGMMEAIPGFYGWIGAIQDPPDNDCRALWREIDQRVIDSSDR
jgi:hypothetical protein